MARPPAPARTARHQDERDRPVGTSGAVWPEIELGNADKAFASAGWLRPALSPSHKSQTPEPMAPINLAFRLRQILGVGIRAEVVRVLLTTQAPWVNAQTLARSTGYSKRNVHDALVGLGAAGVVSAFTVGGEQRYVADRPEWAALLGSGPDELPAHRDWPQLLAVLRRVLRWSAQPDLATMSDYLRSSRTGDLLEAVSGELAIAGIPIHHSRSPEDLWHHLEEICEQLLKVICVDDALISR